MLSALAEPGSRNLKQRLIGADGFPGLQQPVNFDRFGDAQRDVFMARIENGRYLVVR